MGGHGKVIDWWLMTTYHYRWYYNERFYQQNYDLLKILHEILVTRSKAVCWENCHAFCSMVPLSDIVYSPHLSDFSDPLFPYFQPLNLESRCTLIGLDCPALGAISLHCANTPKFRSSIPLRKASPHQDKTNHTPGRTLHPNRLDSSHILTGFWRIVKIRDYVTRKLVFETWRSGGSSMIRLCGC